MKRVIVLIIMLLAFSFNAAADVYNEQFDKSGAGKLPEFLSDDTRETLENEGITPEGDWVNNLSPQKAFSSLLESIKRNSKAPLLTALSALGLSIMLSVFRLFSDRPESEQTLSFAATASIAGITLLPLFSAVSSAAATLKNAAVFMLSFVPVYCGITAASGRIATASASGAVLLLAGETVVWLASLVVLPLIGAYLAIALCGSLTPAIELTPLAETVKKAATWVTGLVMTVYIGILGIQTTVNAAADNLAVRTGKFLIGSFVPVVGSPVSEALTTVQASVGLLRSSVGIYGVVAVAVTVLPSALLLLLWRGCLLLSSAAAGILECRSIGKLLKACDAAVSFALGMTLICSVAFIISLAVLASIGG